MKILSDIWNDCPICGKQLIFDKDLTILICSTKIELNYSFFEEEFHYIVYLNVSDFSIESEDIFINSNIYIATFSKGNSTYDIDDDTNLYITIFYKMYNDNWYPIFKSDKYISLCDVKKILALL